jgi:hypothetical protein
LVDQAAIGRLGGRPRKPRHEPDLTVSKRGFFDELRHQLDHNAEAVVAAVLQSKNPVGISSLSQLAYQKGAPETPEARRFGMAEPVRMPDGSRVTSLADVLRFSLEIGQGNLLKLGELWDDGLLEPALRDAGVLVEDDEASASAARPARRVLRHLDLADRDRRLDHPPADLQSNCRATTPPPHTLER